MAGNPETKDEATEFADNNQQDFTPDYPAGARLAAILLSLILSTFLVALDNVSCKHHGIIKADQACYQTILSTAIPKITDEFQDLNKVSWYGAVYFMTFGGSKFWLP